MQSEGLGYRRMESNIFFDPVSSEADRILVETPITEPESPFYFEVVDVAGNAVGFFVFEHYASIKGKRFFALRKTLSDKPKMIRQASNLVRLGFIKREASI